MVASFKHTPLFQGEERELLRLAVDLGAGRVGGPLTAAEDRLFALAQAVDPAPAPVREAARNAILDGGDPLGERLCRVRPAVERRAVGAFYTQPALVEPMVQWVLAREPKRLVDAGCGSGRFVAHAVRINPDLSVVAVDVDPLATLLTRAALAVLDASAATVLQADYTELDLPAIAGRTAFIGNPPYVRHHDLPPSLKAWAVAAARKLGYQVSSLAGLHVYFYLATALSVRPGDVGCFVTSAEWLDVNYGSILRRLLLGRLGGRALHVIDPRAVPFADAMTTAAIVCFEVGAIPCALRLRLIEAPEDLDDLDRGKEVERDELAKLERWTPLLRADHTADGNGTVPLGAVARVHRGVVTGANDFFILTQERAREFGVEPWCRPAITGAEEILVSGGIVRAGPERRLVLDVPADADRRAHPRLDAYLQRGEQANGADPPVARRYIPSHRKPWWHLALSDPPPIVASYMARQAPVFALNPDGLAIVNIAHGIYPHHRLTPEQLAALVAALNEARNSFRGRGRT